MPKKDKYSDYNEYDQRDWWNEAEREIFIKTNTEILPEETSDAVVWIEGDAKDRAEKTIEVFNHYGQEPNLILSGGLEGNPYRPDADKYPNGGNIPSWKMKEEFLKRNIPENKIILEDESLNALDQAINVVNIAKERGFNSIVLVASMWHQPRLFLTFVKQLHEQNVLDIELINQPETKYSLDREIPGRGKNTTEMIKEDLWRITRYNDNNTVAVAEKGLKYLENFDKKYREKSDKIKKVLDEIKLKDK